MFELKNQFHIMKKNYLIFVILFSLFNINGQNNKTIKWINENSIEIEDVSPDSELTVFKDNTPNKFANAKVFGFGEASHNTKEFFDIKAKFFKHLVKNQGVKTFIMEDSYQAESGINEWISGGEGDIKTIAKNFNIGFWKNKEIVNLLFWMRNYNRNKTKENQIRFYGMDIQLGTKINTEIREFVTKNSIQIDEKLLKIADSCANKKIDYRKYDDWWEKQIPKLKKLKNQISNSATKQKGKKSILRSLNYLIMFTEYASKVTNKYPESTEFRDLKMFENVKTIIGNFAKNEKVFIWAHNEHINKKEMYYYGSNIENVGSHLKIFYKQDYYCVGFDFGTGNIDGYVIDKNKGSHIKKYYIEKPFNKTYAKTLMAVNKDIYFIDLQNAIEKEPTGFFSKKRKQLLIAAGGYQPKPLNRVLMNKIYAETYDGLIFVKKISKPDYNLNK